MIDPVVSGLGGFLSLLTYETNSTMRLIPFESSKQITLAMVCGCEKFESSYSFRMFRQLGWYLVRERL